LPDAGGDIETARPGSDRTATRPGSKEYGTTVSTTIGGSVAAAMATKLEGRGGIANPQSYKAHRSPTISLRDWTRNGPNQSVTPLTVNLDSSAIWLTAQTIRPNSRSLGWPKLATESRSGVLPVAETRRFCSTRFGCFTGHLEPVWAHRILDGE
jgi:hypothetical protein